VAEIGRSVSPGALIARGDCTGVLSVTRTAGPPSRKESERFGFGLGIGSRAVSQMEILANDRGLLLRFREGDREALAQVYWAHVDSVERVLRARFFAAAPSTWGGSASDLEDVVQEVFIKAFAPEARRSYDGLRPYGPFLLTIARHVLADWCRRRGREIPTDIEPPEADEGAVFADATAAFADARKMALVERFVHALPRELRAVHEARFGEGLSQRDAAAALGIGRQRLRTLEQRLTAMLRETLEESDPGSAVARDAGTPPPRESEQERGRP
jgi:RNA polymerase sigma factor (sigma-70 family)